MSRTYKDNLIGRRFGRLVGISFIPDSTNRSSFLFRCDCGNEKIIEGSSVKRGYTISCGCFHKERVRETSLKHGHNKSVGERNRTYSIWANMMDRCEWGGNKKCYKQYGERGIRVCKRWHNYENFLADMGECPPALTIERIDNDKGYNKNNCKWATRHEQALNRSNTRKVIYNNEVITAYELCEKLGLSINAVRSRATRRNNNFVEAFKSIGIECGYV